MRVPFTWRPTGWFQIRWSADFPAGGAHPLRYFGEDMVAYRDGDGDLHVLEAHCRHLGAHIGYGGRVVGDCVQCRFHGWQWGPDGHNAAIPGQDRPNRSKRLRVWPVVEQHGPVFLGHHPDGAEPTWEMLDVFGCHPELDVPPDAYYPPYPSFVRKDTDEPVHPQIVLENSADSAHFEYVHRASVTPKVLHWSHDEHLWYFIAGYPDTRSEDPDDMILKPQQAVRARRRHQRLYTIWWTREPGDTADEAPPHVVERVTEEFLSTVDDDLTIWRHQLWIDTPAYSRADAKGYVALRTWSQQFYDLPPEQT